MVGFHIEDAAHQFVCKVVGEECVLVSLQSLYAVGMTRHIFIGEANEKRYAHIAEAGEVWRTVSVGNRGVVAEIYHRLQVQAFAGIFIKSINKPSYV